MVKTKLNVFIASDGKEFEDLDYGEFYELYHCKLNERQISLPEGSIVDFTTVEQVKEFVKDHFYNDAILTFEYEELILPNTYVFIETPYENIENNGENDIWIKANQKNG